MRGLILKDLLTLKTYGRSFIVIILVFGSMAFISDDTTFSAGFIAVMFAVMVVTSMSYDERSKWNMYALSMPISRKQLVLSKYIMSVIFVLAGILIGLLISFAPLIMGNSTDIQGSLWSLFGSACVGLILLSIFLPLIYKFGTEKSRIIILVLFFLPVMALSILATKGLIMPTEASVMSALKLVPVISIIMFIISYFISVAIFQKKDI